MNIPIHARRSEHVHYDFVSQMTIPVISQQYEIRKPITQLVLWRQY